jgi:hypothetical protein
MRTGATPYGLWWLDDVNSGIGPIGLPEDGFRMFFAFSENGTGSFSTLPGSCEEMPERGADTARNRRRLTTGPSLRRVDRG